MLWRANFFNRNFSAGQMWLVIFLTGWFSTVIRAATPVATDPDRTSVVDWVFEATNHMGVWIWETNVLEKQTVCFWRSFAVPAGKPVSRGILRLTVDNGYTLFLDGEEIGRGSDWRTITEYDVTAFLKPGLHTLAVEGFNDRLEGGLIAGLWIEFADGSTTNFVSDNSWAIISRPAKNWAQKDFPRLRSHPVKVVGPMTTPPWDRWPIGVASLPLLKPVQLQFWQRGWFQLGLFLTCVGVGLFCLWLLTQLSAQARARKVLQIERVRIARDIHDDLGAQLTQILLMAEVAQREQPEASPARAQFAQLTERARELAHAMDEVVWAVNARRDTVRDFTSYVCKYAQIYLAPTGIRCRLDVEPEMPATTFDLPVRRNLLLAVKEALNNAAKHSQAEELFLRISRHEKKLCVAVEDNGRGFDPETVGDERNGLTNMAQRLAEIGGTYNVSSQPGGGCLVVFTVPLPRESRRWFRPATPGEPDAPPMDFTGPGA